MSMILQRNRRFLHSWDCFSVPRVPCWRQRKNERSARHGKTQTHVQTAGRAAPTAPHSLLQRTAGAPGGAGRTVTAICPQRAGAAHGNAAPCAEQHGKGDGIVTGCGLLFGSLAGRAGGAGRAGILPRFILKVIGTYAVRVLVRRVAVMIMIFPCAAVVVPALPVGAPWMRQRGNGQKQQSQQQEAETAAAHGQR